MRLIRSYCPVKMKPIPIKPVWYLIGRTNEGSVKSFDRYWTAYEAKIALEQTRSISDGLVYTVDESESIIPDRRLPTRKQIVELGKFFQRAFVVLRYISYGRKNFEAIEQLTDILHNMPTEMFDSEQWNWNFYICALWGFQEKFPDVQTANLAEMLESIRDNTEQDAGSREESGA